MVCGTLVNAPGGGRGSGTDALTTLAQIMKQEIVL